MCEVTNKNFDEIYNEIIDNLQSATFLSIDCEFSGLFDDRIKCNLFDTPKKRFNKLQSSLANYIIIQFGLSTFKYERTNNSFTVSTYNFYLKPATELEDEKFMFGLRSVEFLCKNKFNFNKLFYDGIHYLNKSNEKVALTKVEEESLINEDNGEEIQKCCSKISEWLGEAQEGSEMFLELNDKTSTFVCLLHQEVRKRFPNVWTYFEERKVVKVRKVNSSEKRVLSSSKEETLLLREKLFKSILGFSHIMKEIERLKKPIVGHNVLIDLIMIYKQFYNPSPISYKQFKKAVSDVFPTVFDTKNISFTLRDFLLAENKWNSNMLSELYGYLKDGKGARLVIFSPTINHKNDEFIRETRFHDAGFDSYCAGFCFLKMAHIFSLKGEERNTFKLTSLRTSSAWLLAAVAPMKNKINVTRGQVNYIALDGDDPRSSRPGLLYIESRTKRPLNISKVSEVLAKYPLVDIQPLTKYKGLMAVPTKKLAEILLERFKHDKEVKLTKYNFLRHSHLGRFVSVALVVLTGFFVSKVLRA